MSPLILDGADRVPAERGDVVVLVPIYGAHDRFVECVRSVLAHTPLRVPILMIDDASPDDRSRSLLTELGETGAVSHHLHYVRHEENLGFVRTANEAFERCDPADVIVLSSDCVVTDGWLDAMTAASQGSLVATVSVLTSSGTILSLPDRNQPRSSLPQTLDLDVAARAIKSHSLRIRPRLPSAIGHCFLVKRTALDLVGAFDQAFSPGYGEAVDFSQRCVHRGLVHVLADDAFVMHTGSSSLDPESEGDELTEEYKHKIGVRYGYYEDWISAFSTTASGPFPRAIGAAGRSLRSLSVTIDARCLGPIVTGTQIHTLEALAALSREQGLRVRAVVPAQLGDYARAVLTGLADVEIVPVEATRYGAGRTDVVHRPMQVSSADDLESLQAMGERIVITHQDLIAYHNPRYFSSFGEWEDYRRLTRYSLSCADRVVFFSHSASHEAIAEELVESSTVEVVYIGTNHTIDAVPAYEHEPPGIELLAGRPYLLCLGTDFSHKNRVFALRVLESLRREHEFGGGLVFAGPHVPIGSSAADEAEFRAKHPELQDSVFDVAAVDEGEKRWLMRNATLMVYPSVHEGFGLVPFESAELGVACAFASNTSIAELLPSKLALIQQWDPDVTAARLVPYIESPALRAEHAAAVRAAGARFTWRTTAGRLVDVYRAAADQPISRSRWLVEEWLSQRPDRGHFGAFQQRRVDLRGRYDKTAEGLVDLNGLIPPDLQRPLLAIDSRPALRRMIFGSIRAAYVGGYRLRHAGRAPKD